MKLLDLLEGWNDPPEYNEPSRSGFRDDSLDGVKPTMKFIAYDKYDYKSKEGSDYILVMDPNTNKGYVFHKDMVPDEYYQSDYYSEYDQDEDGYYSYDEFDDENAELTSDSYEVFATIMFKEGNITDSFDEYENGDKILLLNRKSLKELSEYDKDGHRAIMNMIMSPKK